MPNQLLCQKITLMSCESLWHHRETEDRCLKMVMGKKSNNLRKKLCKKSQQYSPLVSLLRRNGVSVTSYLKTPFNGKLNE